MLSNNGLGLRAFVENFKSRNGRSNRVSSRAYNHSGSQQHISSITIGLTFHFQLCHIYRPIQLQIAHKFLALF